MTIAIVTPAAEVPPAGSGWALGAVDWIRQRHGRPPMVDDCAEGTAVVVLPSRPETAARVRSALRRAGYLTECGRLPTREQEPAGGTTDDPNLAVEQQWYDMLERVGDDVSVVAYAVPFGGPSSVHRGDLAEQLDAGLHGLLACARAVARWQRRQRRPVTLLLLTSHAVDVTGAESVNPATAMLYGLSRTVAQEHPGVRCILVDAPSDTPADVLGSCLSELGEPLVAVRGSSTWLPVLRVLPRSGRPGRPRLRRDGVYLVTGGFGGIGLAVARALADTGLRPRIALLGRAGQPAADTARGIRVAAAACDMLGAGAEVMTVAADVSDPVSLAAAVVAVEKRFGPVQGVVHSAGLPGGGLLERRSREDIEATLAAKVDGVLSLDAVFVDRPPLDFLVLFSSHAGLNGMFGRGDYAAANAFLDAYAQQHACDERWTISAAWPAWSGVGMVTDTAVDVAALLTGASPAAAQPLAGELEFRRTYREETDWELDEHRFGGRPLLSGTAQLELVVTAAQALGLLPEATGLELRDTALLSPIDGAEPVEVSVLFTPLADVFRFRVRSRPAGTDAGWTHRANGTLAPPGERAAPLDVARPDLPQPPAADSSDWPEYGDDWSQFGPRWDCPVTTTTTGDEIVSRLMLAEVFRPDVQSHPLHPGLLDRALMIEPVTEEPSAAFLPFLYRRVTVFGTLPTDLLVVTRMLPDTPVMQVRDVDIHHPETGEVLVQIRSYTLRKVSAEDFSAALRRPAEPGTRRPPAPPAPAMPAVSGTLPEPALPTVSPAEGASAFLELLDGAYPPAVIVTAPGELPEIAGVPWVTDGTRPTPRAAVPTAPPAQAPVVTEPTDQGSVVASVTSSAPDEHAGADNGVRHG